MPSWTKTALGASFKTLISSSAQVSTENFSGHESGEANSHLGWRHVAGSVISVKPKHRACRMVFFGEDRDVPARAAIALMNNRQLPRWRTSSASIFRQASSAVENLVAKAGCMTPEAAK